MKILKNIVLYLLLLVVMIIGGTVTLKIYDLILDLDFENIWASGFKTGLIAWFLMLGYIYYRRAKNAE